jgi:lysozyme
MNYEKLIESIKDSEGGRLKLYKCPAKKWTIGWGRNIQENGISSDEAEFMLKNDLNRCKLELESRLTFFYDLNDARQNVLIEMVFNMGITRFMTFKHTLHYIEKEQFGFASHEMLKSKWHRDFQKYAPKHKISSLRSSKLSEILRKGEY